MLTREVSRRIEAEWQQANDLNASAIRQFEAMLRAALLITKTQTQIAGAGKNQWDHAAGLAAGILTTPSGAVGDGQYDADYLRKIQAMWASYTVWLATPISATVNGQPVTLTEKPIDLISSSPVTAQPVEPTPLEGGNE